jgi:hypothetical protein
VVVKLTEYDALSTPPIQTPFTPFVFAEVIFPMGVPVSTPEYRDTAITALDGAALSVAVTAPLPVGDPIAFHTSTRVWFRPAH